MELRGDSDEVVSEEGSNYSISVENEAKFRAVIREKSRGIIVTEGGDKLEDGTDFCRDLEFDVHEEMLEWGDAEVHGA